MLSRRQILVSAVSATIAAAGETSSVRQEKLTHLLLTPSESNPIANESALGYSRLLQSAAYSFEASNQLNSTGFRHIVLPGVRALSTTLAASLHKSAAAGSWLIFESGLCFASKRETEIQRGVLAEVFDITIDGTRSTQRGGASARSYVHYRWPLPAMAPDFTEWAAIKYADADAIAAFHNEVVAIRRRIGRGGIVFLGSPLGPGLFAADRESQLIVERMLSINTQSTEPLSRQGWQSSNSSV
jgi:hypothetical protein